jgi:Tfp pilus assembly protein PilV
MEEHVYLITLAAVFGTVIVVFGMRAFAAVQPAKLRSAAHSETAAALAAIQSTLAEMRARPASVEKTLKDVG